LHAQNLVTAAWISGRDEFVLPGGDGPGDLASATLLKFLDPLDTSVMWAETKGQPTTRGLLAFLQQVLERDFLDLKRSKRATTAVYLDSTTPGDNQSGAAVVDPTADTLTPEEEALRRERVRWILEQFEDDTDLYEVVRLQLEPTGYNAFSNQELAGLLNTTVPEIENRKRRVKLRLKRLAASGLARETEHV
jgi:DNA-directed RNA polymerase specialized sigma24 family protein